MIFNRAGIGKYCEGFLLFLFVLVSTLGMVKGGAWASIVIVGAVILMLLVWGEQKKFPWPEKQMTWFVVFFLGAATGLSFLSSFQDVSFYSTAKLASIFVPLLFLSSPSILKLGDVLWRKREELADILALGFALTSLALVLASLIYGFESEPVTKLNRGVSYGILMVWPLFAATLGGALRKQGLLLLGTVLLALLLTHSRTTQAGAICAFGVFVGARFWPVLMTRLLAWGMVLTLLWPFVVRVLFCDYRDFVFRLPTTLGARVEIWDYMAHRIAESPWIGWGIGVSSKLDWLVPHGDLYKYTESAAAHPHNVIIQLWAEMGLLGLVFGFLACFWVFQAIKKLNSAYVPYALASLTFGYVLLLAAYNFWTDSLWAALALTIFLFACFSKAEIKASLRATPQDEKKVGGK